MDDMTESEVSLQREAEALRKKLLEAETRSTHRLRRESGRHQQ